MKMKRVQDNEPLLVIVTETEYKCYGTSPRARELFQLLQSIGGINHSVKPGNYYFNAEVLDPESAVVTLDPVPE